MQNSHLPVDSNLAALMLINAFGDDAAHEAALQTLTHIASDDSDRRQYWLAVLRSVLGMQTESETPSLH